MIPKVTLIFKVLSFLLFYMICVSILFFIYLEILYNDGELFQSGEAFLRCVLEYFYTDAPSSTKCKIIPSWNKAKY